MRNYEVTTVFREGKSEETKKAVKEILEKHSAKITSEEDWGTKRLFHPVKHNESGFFSYIKCTIEDPSRISAIENDFRLNQEILKSMIIKVG